jgi:hypothetical protein
MKRNYSIYIDLGAGYTLVDSNCIKQIESADFAREKNEMFYRIKIGEITFQNIPSYKIYNLISDVDFTTEMKVKVVYGSLTVEGYFAKIDCSFDEDKNGKIIKAKPAIQDQYRRFLENYETEIELTDHEFDYETTTARLTADDLDTYPYWSERTIYARKTLSEIEWAETMTPETAGFGFADFFYGSGEPNVTKLTTPPYNATDNESLNIQDVIDTMAIDYYELSELTIWLGEPHWAGGGLFSNPKVKIKFYVTCEFSRESIFIPTSDGTVTGDKVLPVGGEEAGWELLTEEPISSSRRSGSVTGVYGYRFARKPFNGAYGMEGSNDWTLGDIIANAGNGGTVDFTWIHKRTTKIHYPFSDADNGELEVNTLINIKDLFTYMYQQLHPDLALKEVKSLFFFNDDEATYSFMTNRFGTNYVTNKLNELNNLKFIHTYGLRTEESEDDEDSILKFSFKDIYEDLQKLFPVKYFIDSELNLHIEHEKFFELIKTSEDISDKKEISMTNQFEFDTSQLFGEKIFNMINAGYEDFTDNSMTFAQAVSNKRNKDNKIEVTTEIITTDLKYCLKNPNSLENGLILVISDGGEITSGIGLKSGVDQINGELSLSQLLTKYWTYSGVWTTGEINGNEQSFENASRSKVGIELKFRGINPSLFYATQIGTGLQDDGKLDFENEITSVKLRYRYTSNTIGDDASYLVWATDGLYDFENSEN